MAHVEVFILNFNGSRFLDECLLSLKKIHRGSHHVEISVVDNGSTDDSKSITEKHQEVHFIELNKNYGFSRGNNLGVWSRCKTLSEQGKKPDYVVFLNNDTHVEPEWLINAISRFQSDPSIGVLGSKANFYDHFVSCSFSCAPGFNPSDHGSSDTRDLGVYVSHHSTYTNIHHDMRRSKWIDAYQCEPHGGRWLKPSGRIFLAVENPNEKTEINFVFDNGNTVPVNISLSVGGEEKSICIKPGSSESIYFSINPASYSHIIQNAGSFVTSDWLAGDEGCYDSDRGHYESSREVAAVCGVSMFLPLNLFVELQGFDETFFAYFEDTDLSLRAKVLGKRCWYEASSRLRHIHCGSGGEFSAYFNYNVTFSHLFFCSRWMNSLNFFKKLLKVSTYAWHELKVYRKDRNLETKPNLKTLIKSCLLSPRIIKNRIFNSRNKRTIKGFYPLFKQQ